MQLSVDRPPVKPPSPFLPAPVPVHCGAHFSWLYKYTYKSINKNINKNTNSFCPLLPAPVPECIQQPGNLTRPPYSMSRSDISVLSFISAGIFVAGIWIFNQHQKIFDIALFSVDLSFGRVIVFPSQSIEKKDNTSQDHIMHPRCSGWWSISRQLMYYQCFFFIIGIIEQKHWLKNAFLPW